MKTQNDPLIDPLYGRRFELHLLAEAGDLQHWRIQVPGTRLQSTDIVFTDQHTSIFGDLCPGRNGVCSSLGIGRSFLSRERGPRYIAEKFLKQDWHQDLARSELIAMHKSGEHPGLDEDAISELNGLIDDYDVRGFYDWFTERDYEGEDVPGYGYEPCDLRLLHLVNVRFARLYTERIATRDTGSAPSVVVAGHIDTMNM